MARMRVNGNRYCTEGEWRSYVDTLERLAPAHGRRMAVGRDDCALRGVRTDHCACVCFVASASTRVRGSRRPTWARLRVGRWLSSLEWPRVCVGARPVGARAARASRVGPGTLGPGSARVVLRAGTLAIDTRGSKIRGV